MADTQITTDTGASGATTALLAILVIAVIGFGLWYIVKSSAAPAAQEQGAKVLDIEIGGGAGNQSPQPPANQY